VTATVPHGEPFARFAALFERARSLPHDCVPDPSAMSLATADADGRPSNRIVLLKGFDERGFVFYTNLDGRKGRELRANPHAALCFHWAPLEEQVRIEGTATVVDDAEADAYFASRGRGSQIGAWASTQSARMTNATELDERVAAMEARFAGHAVPRPANWSGFRVAPDRVEFWTNRPNRLHERRLYVRAGDCWRVETLFP